MPVRIPALNNSEPKKPLKESGRILILMDCSIPHKKGSKKRVSFTEGQILEYKKIHKEKIKACCGAPSGYSYYYVISDSNILLPIVLGKEL